MQAYMGLGPDALTLYCDADHGRLDLAFVDVAGEPGTWRGWVHRDAVEGRVEHAGTFSQPGSEYVQWRGLRLTGREARSMASREPALRVSCPRCRRGRLPQGATLRVKGGVLHTLVAEHGLHEVSLRFVEASMRRVAR
jgi:hypothetical protein